MYNSKESRLLYVIVYRSSSCDKAIEKNKKQIFLKYFNMLKMINPFKMILVFIFTPIEYVLFPDYSK